MVKQTSTAEILFSLDQANAMLPLLRLIVADISLAHRELAERRHQLHRLIRRREDSKARIYNDEIEETKSDLKQESLQLEEYIHELEGLGVTLRSAFDGIIDFPTIIGDQAAFYVWKMGELHVNHWRWPNETFSQRRILPLSDRS
jgi:hypothetical protein